jgi:hypothetical protein
LIIFSMLEVAPQNQEPAFLLSFTSTPMLAVYAGQTCIGHLYRRSKAGFEAFNTDDRSIGLFGSQREAADALSSGAHQ